MSNQPQIDWSVFERFEQNTCECRCGTEYRSHSKVVNTADGMKVFTRKPCPNCGASDRLRRVSSPAERQTL